MTYTLDASVALKWEPPEPDSDNANRLRDDFRNGVHDLIAPDPFILEVAHGLAKAERERCEFVTADDRLVRALQPTFPFITSLSALP
jgi:predicted nucleic acid-binding protein